MKCINDMFYKRININDFKVWKMFDPYSKEEEEYVRYLIKKYLPGLGSREDKTGPSIMFKNDKKP